MPTHHVVIYPDSASSSVVNPPHLPVGGGDQIIFHATMQGVKLLFPPGTPLDFDPRVIYGDPGWAIIPLEKGRPQPLTVLYDAAPGRYPYAVWCDDENPTNRRFAKGGSDPEIIVY